MARGRQDDGRRGMAHEVAVEAEQQDPGQRLLGQIGERHQEAEGDRQEAGGRRHEGAAAGQARARRWWTGVAGGVAAASPRMPLDPDQGGHQEEQHQGDLCGAGQAARD